MDTALAIKGGDNILRLSRDDPSTAYPHFPTHLELHVMLNLKLKLELDLGTLATNPELDVFPEDASRELLASLSTIASLAVPPF
jgi:hypothetical protein